ncbi:TonB-dependent siderophore receptor [Xylophilus sp. Leaf220]|uniref:TonB-dependent receptor n=1 Tax=Xylophilus sp. Leaf220 TaxID=1735686 RepID=UPI0006FCDE5D|nr:TonB-dependent siderophore receptor [Xylophilus sp. Leaf220]KQM68964.1 TonB-dependent receptor [Xylophilus sp. Leaf220]
MNTPAFPLNALCTALFALAAGGAAHAQPAPAGTQLREVTVNAAGESEGYSPAAATTATKGSAPLRDVPQAVNVVPQQLLRDQAAMSVQDALRNVPGVAFSSGDGQRDQVNIRGFSAIADQFVDGVRDDALYFRDLADVERIEVLKGPAAVLYGRGSSGGLINRVTKKPVFGSTFGEAGVTLGSHSTKRLTGDINTPLGESAAFRLNVSREDSGSYRDQQFLDRFHFAPALALKLGSATDLLLQYTNARDQRLTDFGIPALNGRPVPVAPSTYYGSGNARRDDTTTSRVESFTATLNHRFGDTLKLRNIARYSEYTLDRFNTLPSGDTNPVAMTVGRTRSSVQRQESGWFNQTDLTWQNQLFGLRQEWLVGTEFGRQKKRAYSVSGGVVDTVPLLDPAGRVPPAIAAAAYLADSAIPSNSTFDTRAVYAQNQITLAPQWKALVGLRYDDFGQATSFERKLNSLERSDTKISPRAGLVWQPSESQSYYASVSRSFQPSAETFALSAAIAGAAPEITTNREIGAKLDFLDGALSTTAALFSLERTNIKNTDPANPARQINVGTQRTNGLELTASGRLPGRWDLSAGYAYLDGKMVESLATTRTNQLPIAQVAALGKTAALTPRHSGSVWAMKDLGAGFSAGGGLQLVGARFTSLTNQVTLPGYVSADLAAVWRTGPYEIAANLKNATDKRYYVSAHGSVDNLILPGAPRELFVTLRARF